MACPRNCWQLYDNIWFSKSLSSLSVTKSLPQTLQVMKLVNVFELKNIFDIPHQNESCVHNIADTKVYVET